jgi:hypothetical protein
LIIPSATHDDPLLQARSPGEPGHKAPEKSGLYPKSPKVADDVIEAHGLLTSRFPALGILVARGVLPLGSFLDAGVLLERLLMARDRLDLSPQDPIETVVEAVHLNVMDPREADSESLADVHRSLAAKEVEVVVYPRHADKYLGPLASRLRAAYQPVSRTPNQFSTPRPRPLVGI